MLPWCSKGDFVGDLHTPRFDEKKNLRFIFQLKDNEELRSRYQHLQVGIVPYMGPKDPAVTGCQIHPCLP